MKTYDIDDRQMTYAEWKMFMFEECKHDSFFHTEIDSVPYSICTRCKFITHTSIAREIEGES